MDALERYFSLPSSPEPKSPMGELMRRILADDPGLSFEQARSLARKQLLKAAGRKNYRVTTPRQDEVAAERMKARVNPTPETAKTGVSSQHPITSTESALGAI